MSAIPENTTIFEITDDWGFFSGMSGNRNESLPSKTARSATGVES